MTFQLLNHTDESRNFFYLFGNKLVSTFSQKMHNLWLKNHDINATYKNYIIHEPQEFIQVLTTLKSDQNFLGGNVTMPLKQTLVKEFKNTFKYSKTVKNTASANTLFRDHLGSLSLENTDVIGIKKTINILCPKNICFENTIVLGGGGAAASCIYALLDEKISNQIMCITRNPLKTENNFDESTFLRNSIKHHILSINHLNGVISNKLETNVSDIINSTQPILIINTMPLGATSMYIKQNKFCCSILEKRVNNLTYFFDLVYENTDACLFAQKHRIPFINGMHMLKTQAKESFKLWTGINV